jgi:hypothetical protein
MSEQSLEKSNAPNVSAQSSFEPTSPETVQVPDATAPVAAAPETKPTEPEKSLDSNTDGELPEYAKRRLGKEQKKFERETARLKAELDQERSRNAQMQSQPQFQQQGVYRDPYTGMQVDVNTPEGAAIYGYQQQLSQTLAQQEKEQQQRLAQEEIHRLADHVEDSQYEARQKHSDYDQVINTANFRPEIAREFAYFPNPAELAYFIGANPREVDRIQRLPAYEMRRELAKHLADMVSRNNVTKSPPPVSPLGATGGTPAKHFAHKTLAELKAERKAHYEGRR